MQVMCMLIFPFSCIQKSFEEAMESLEKGKALKDKR